MPGVVSVNVSVPLLAIAPFQPPEEKQLVALTDDQVMVMGESKAMEFAESVSVGAAGTVVVPPLPLLPPPPPHAASRRVARAPARHIRKASGAIS
jgi:hypothetical protein